MRFVKQVIFTIFVVVLLGACGKSKTSEQVITDQNEKARAELEYIRKSTAYVYDSTGCTPAASYVFRATLESTNTALNSDLDGTICTDTACDDATFQYCVGP